MRPLRPLTLFALLGLGTAFVQQETPPAPQGQDDSVPATPTADEAEGEDQEEPEPPSEEEQRALLAGGRSHKELVDDAIRAAAGGDWATAIHASTVGILLEDYMDELQRAEAHYLQGWVLGQKPVTDVLQQAENVRAAEAGEEPRQLRSYLGAMPGFEEARVLAGRGDLRLMAIYNLGCVHLLDGDEWRAEIPEIAQAQGGGQPAPGMPGMPGMPPGGAGGAAGAEGEEPPDPLERSSKKQ